MMATTVTEIVPIVDVVGVTAEVTRECPQCEIDFEEGDLSDFVSVVDADADLTVINGAALAGTNYGLNCRVNGSHTFYGYVNQIDRSDVIRMRMYIDVNGLSMPDDYEIKIVDAHQDGGDSYTFFVINLNYTIAEGYKLRFAMFSEGEVYWNGWYMSITDAPHYVEVLCAKATTELSSDGYGRCWIDGADQGLKSGIDNYNIMSDIAKFGFNIGIMTPATSLGDIFLDEIIINRTGTLIGPR